MNFLLLRDKYLVYQLIDQCRSRHTLTLIIWEARVVES
jgi:hypothetical protein